jgi:hypothetical protein
MMEGLDLSMLLSYNKITVLHEEVVLRLLGWSNPVRPKPIALHGITACWLCKKMKIHAIPAFERGQSSTSEREREPLV